MSQPLRIGTKVLFVITKSNWGGAQAYVYALARAVREAGGEAVVALGGTGTEGAEAGLLADKLKTDGIRVIFLDSFMRDVSVFKEIAAYRSLVELFRAERPDVVHLNSSKAGGLGALAARAAHVPLIVFTAHGWAHREPRPAFARALIRFLSWLTVALCHRVIVVSKLDLGDAPALFFRRKLRLVTNGISAFPMMEKMAARAALSERSSIHAAATWIVAISELHFNKGIDVLIRSLALLKNEHEKPELVVMGGGEEMDRLRKLAETLGIGRRVHLLGFTANAKQYLRAADIYALPSRKEGMPFAVLEAGLAELPVVASTVGGVPEVVMNDVTGLLVKPDDEHALAQALDALIGNKQLRQTFAERLHRRIVEDYSEARMVRETFGVYATNS